MAEILGLGLTHGPFVLYPEETFSQFLRRNLKKDDLPAELRDPANWPGPMQDEWSNDEGLTAAKEHRARLEHDPAAPNHIAAREVSRIPQQQIPPRRQHHVPPARHHRRLPAAGQDVCACRQTNVPRPQIKPSRMIAPNGSMPQAFSSTGTTSR